MHKVRTVITLAVIPWDRSEDDQNLEERRQLIFKMLNLIENTSKTMENIEFLSFSNIPRPHSPSATTLPLFSFANEINLLK